MNDLIAKLRMQGKACKYRKILSTEETVYPLFDEMVTSETVYSPGNGEIDEGEWYFVAGCSSQNFALDIMKDGFETVDFDALTRPEYKHIDYIFTKDDEKLCFQNIGKSRLIHRKRILYFGERYEYQDNSEEITINDLPDAIYKKDSDTLYFRNLSSITGIFKGIDQLYREATEEETEAFLQEDFIALGEGYAVDKVKTANRKRIAIARDTLKQLSDTDRGSIFSYIGDYCPQLKTPDNKFKVGNEEQLKMVLYGIEQRFYTTLVGGERRIANSVKKLSDTTV